MVLHELRMHRMNIREMLQKRGSLICLILLCVFSAFKYDVFLSAHNLANILYNASVLGIVSLGMTFVVITGGIDLAVGSMVALAGVIAALTYPDTGEFSIFIVLGSGILSGAVVGFCISRLDIAPFITTMAIQIGLRGICHLVTESKIIGIEAGTENTTLIDFLAMKIAGIPVAGIIWILLTVICWFLLYKTTWGRNVYAIGNNDAGAALCGINTRRTKMAVYMMSGLLSAIAGLIYAARLGVGQPTAGEGYEMQAVLAVVMGGTLITGGSGTVAGTFVGVFILAVLDNMLNMQGNIDNSVRNCIIGFIFLIVVITQDKLSKRKGDQNE